MIRWAPTFIAILTVTILGCATQPLYSPAKDSESMGYYETKLTDDRYRVVFTGGLNTTADTVKNLALLRAAEITADNGFDWFQIIDRESVNAANTDSPKVSVSVGVGTGRVGRCYPFGCGIYGGPFYTGVGLHATERTDRRQSVIEILMGKGEPQDPTKVYNAQELEKNLRDQIARDSY